MPQAHQPDAPDDRQRHAARAPVQIIREVRRPWSIVHRRSSVVGRKQRYIFARGLDQHQRLRIQLGHAGQADGVGDVDAVAGGDDRLGRVGQLAQEAQQLLVVDGLQVVDDQQRALGRQRAFDQPTALPLVCL